jgi:hypothetical protein
MSKRRGDEEWDDLDPVEVRSPFLPFFSPISIQQPYLTIFCIVFQLLPSGSIGRSSHSDQLFANFESTLSGSKKRSRSDRDGDAHDKDKRGKDKDKKHKHDKSKDKHHKEKHKHSDKNKRPKTNEPSDTDELHKLAPSSDDTLIATSSISEEPKRVIPHDPALDLVNTDWMFSAPPPSSWRKKSPERTAPLAPKKVSMELNPQLNPKSQFNTEGTFAVGDGGASWSRTTAYDPNFYPSQQFTQQSSAVNGAARWKREEARQTAEPSSSPIIVHISSHSPAVPQEEEEDLSTVDLNILKSQIMKAKLQKKMELVSQLEVKLARARKLQSSDASEIIAPAHVKVMDDLDEHGRSRSAIAAASARTVTSSSDGHKLNPRTAGLHSETGERLKYFADDDDVDLATLVARERAEKRSAVVGGIQGMDNAYADNVMRKRNYKEEDLFERNFDGDGDVDYGQWETRAKKFSSAELAQRERQSAIQATQRFDKATSNCYYCLKTKKIPGHLIISMGFHTSLVIPERGHLMPGHCIIVPHDHFASSTSMEESVWDEITKFMTALTNYYASQGKEPVFCETVLDLSPWRHTAIDCFPLPKRDANIAPMFFQKAIQESGGEWATHQKLHDFKLPKRTIRNTIPAGFAYFMVQFAVDSGFAHHIEQKQDFSPNFGKSVIGGILELDETLYSGQPRRQSIETEKRLASDFKAGWNDFDWTTTLH